MIGTCIHDPGGDISACACDSLPCLVETRRARGCMAWRSYRPPRGLLMGCRSTLQNRKPRYWYSGSTALRRSCRLFDYLLNSLVDGDADLSRWPACSEKMMKSEADDMRCIQLRIATLSHRMPSCDLLDVNTPHDCAALYEFAENPSGIGSID
jgi:hypothetical protein